MEESRIYLQGLRSQDARGSFGLLAVSAQFSTASLLPLPPKPSHSSGPHKAAGAPRHHVPAFPPQLLHGCRGFRRRRLFLSTPLHLHVLDPAATSAGRAVPPHHECRAPKHPVIPRPGAMESRRPYRQEVCHPGHRQEARRPPPLRPRTRGPRQTLLPSKPENPSNCFFFKILAHFPCTFRSLSQAIRCVLAAVVLDDRPEAPPPFGR